MSCSCSSTFFCQEQQPIRDGACDRVDSPRPVIERQSTRP